MSDTVVVLVEDNEVRRAINSTFPSHAGLDLLGVQQPSLVLLDTSIPKVDVWRVALGIKSAKDSQSQTSSKKH